MTDPTSLQSDVPMRGRTAPLFQPGVSGNPDGRKPKVLRKKQFELIEKAAAQGWRESDIAAAVGLSANTWTKRKREDEKIAAAFERGRGQLHNEMISTLRVAARNGQYVPAIFILRAMFGYQEQNPDDGHTHITINMPGAAIIAPQRGMTIDQVSDTHALPASVPGQEVEPESVSE